MNQKMWPSIYLIIPNSGTGFDGIPQISIKVQIEYEPKNVSVHMTEIYHHLYLALG